MEHNSSLAPEEAEPKLHAVFNNEVLWSADENDEEVLSVLADLESAGIDIAAAKDPGWNTFLHFVAMWNRLSIAETLISKGAILNATNKNGHTPLDLAVHWGHYDLSALLRHYGAKHTCEQERDLAISQRDLAQAKVTNAETEMKEAVIRLRKAKQEREGLRFERDRLLKVQAELVVERNDLLEKVKDLQQQNTVKLKQISDFEVKNAHLLELLEYEKNARKNAIQSWQLAEKTIEQMQRTVQELRSREEEALKMRNDALQERDVAREFARQAQVDLEIATQNQTEAEAEREKALKELLQSEYELGCNAELWKQKMKKVEQARRDIQIEIDRQTDELRSRCKRLEKEVDHLSSEKFKLEQYIESKSETIVRLEKSQSIQNNRLNDQILKCEALQQEIKELLHARDTQYAAWREKFHESLEKIISKDMQRIIRSALAMWRKSCEWHFKASQLEVLLVSPLTDDSFYRPRSSHCTSEDRRVLPPLQERFEQTSLSKHITTSAIEAPSKVDRFDFHHDVELQFWVSTSEEQLSTHWTSSDMSSKVAENIECLHKLLGHFFDAFLDYSTKNLQNSRKQLEASTRIIERKDNIIQRFNQHRQEKPKMTSPAKFRELSHEPLL